jgi:Domain of unknown function (DUF4252)
MNRTPFLAVLIAASLPLAVPASAQSQFGPDLLAAKAKQTVNFVLDSATLRLATSFFTKNDQPENPGFKKLIEGLKNISVKKYTFVEEGQFLPEDLQPLRDQLRLSGWGVLLGLHGSKPGSTEIYTKSEDGHVAGLGVFKVEPKQITVVCVEGVIDLASLASLAGHFGIPALGLPAAPVSPAPKEVQ